MKTQQQSQRTILRLDPMGFFALIGAVVAFVAVGAITETLWVALGAVVGAGIGWVVRRYSREAVAYDEARDLKAGATRDELYEEAKRLGIEGRSGLDKDELVERITAARR